jgi:hypothetical protein
MTAPDAGGFFAAASLSHRSKTKFRLSGTGPTIARYSVIIGSCRSTFSISAVRRRQSMTPSRTRGWNLLITRPPGKRPRPLAAKSCARSVAPTWRRLEDGSYGRQRQSNIFPEVYDRIIQVKRLSWRPLLPVPYRGNPCTERDRFCDRAPMAALPSEIRCHCIQDIYVRSVSRMALSFEPFRLAPQLRPHA